MELNTHDGISMSTYTFILIAPRSILDGEHISLDQSQSDTVLYRRVRVVGDSGGM